MDRTTSYCRSKAAEYERRALEATDERIRTFLYRMRDNWEIAIKDFERIERTRRGPPEVGGARSYRADH